MYLSRKTICLFLCVVFGAGQLLPLCAAYSPLKVEEVDGAPSVTNVKKIVVNGMVMTDDNNGQITLTASDSQTLNGLTSDQFLRSDTSDNYTSGTLTLDSGTEFNPASGSTVDIDGNLEISDTNISLDGASTTFTQTTGAITLAPAAGSNLNVSLSGTGDMVVNTDDFYIDSSTGNIGINETTPSARLEVNGWALIGDADNNVTAIGNSAAASIVSGSSNIVAIGNNSAVSSNGSSINAIGDYAAQLNKGSYVNVMGHGFSARYNEGSNVNMFGNEVGTNNNGDYTNIVGYRAAQNNLGDYVNAFGRGTAGNNEGSNVNAMDWNAAENNNGDYVIAIGNSAARNNLGSYVEALGQQSAQNNTGDYVVAIGSEAAEVNKGAGVIAIGRKAAQLSNGNYNIAIGYQAGDTLKNGAQNILLGYNVDPTDVNGSYQLNIGNTIYGDLDNGEIALGVAQNDPRATLQINGTFMYADGNEAANYVLSSDANGLATWISASVLLSNGGAFLDTLNDVISDRDSNLFLGNGAGLNHTGEYNTGVGIRALTSLTSGNGNVAFGYQAGYDMTSGSDNVLLGKVAANGATSGSGNIFIGNVNGSSTTASNELNIGDLIYGGFSTGNVGIGVEAPANFGLEVAGNIGPDADSIRDLGTSSIRWANAYIDDLTITNNGSFGNDIAVTDDAVIGGDAHITGVVNGGTFDGDFTNGSVLFSNSTGVISEDNSNFYWDNTNDRLAIANGTSPTAKLEINTGSDTEKAVIIKANSAQSVNLLETYENGGALRAAINESGEFTNNGGYSNSEIFGDGVTIAGAATVAIGASTETTDVNSTAIGYNVTSGKNTVAIGANANANASEAVTIGDGSSAGSKTVSIGRAASTSGTGTIALGHGSNANDSGSIAIGFDASSTHLDSIVIGQSASSSAANQLTFGDNTKPVLEIQTNTGNGSLNFDTDQGNYMTVNNGLNLGIGFTSPSAKLAINGSIMIADGTESNGYILMSDANGLASWVSTNSTDAGTLDGLDSLQFLRSDTSDSFTSGTMTFDAGTTVDINSTTLQIADTDITFDGASTTLTQTTGDFNLVPNSNVGIDMASPTQKLDVNGSIAIAASSSSYYIGTSSIMYANGDGNRVTRLGVGAGATFNGSTLYNTAIGYNTLDAANQSGDYNTAIGYTALSANTTGAENTAAGALALSANTTGSFNTAFGSQSLKSNTIGTSNVAVGREAMENSTTGDYNVAIGRIALWTNTGGDNNIAMGYRSLVVSNGDNNVAIGYEAGDAITQGSSNTTLGHQAGDNITTGSSNIVIGAGADAVSVDGDYQLNIGNTIYGDLNNGEIALGKVTEDPSAVLEVNGSFMYTDGNEAANYVLSSDANGLASWISASVLLSNGGAFLDTLNDVISDRDSNLFLGNGAGLNHTGDYNTGVGIRALENMVGGDGNVAFGYQAGRDMTSGSDNVLIGKVAGNGATSGTGNIFIGNVNGDSTTATNQLNIGDLLFGEFDNGNIGIGVENPGNFKLEVAGNVGPSADSTHDLGTTAIRWANIYADTTDSTTVNATTINGSTIDGGFTTGSVLFGNASGYITEDNANFFWDDTGNNLGIGTTSPSAKLEVNGYGLIGDAANYVIALGTTAANNITTGSQYINALGYTAAQDSNGDYINALGYRTAEDNVGDHVNAMGYYAALTNKGSQVNAFGNFAGYSNNGDGVNAFGQNAARASTGSSINAFGGSAAYNNIGQHINAFGGLTGQNNNGNFLNAFGYYVAQNNIGDDVIAIGNFTARNNNGDDVVAIGYNAAGTNIGSGVVAIGESTAVLNNGSQTIFIGGSAGMHNIGDYTYGIGNWSARSNEGSYVNSIGYRAANLNNGSYVNAMGREAAENNLGDYLLSFGYQAAENNKGDGNIAIGRTALQNSNGNYNIAIGDLTGSTQKNGAQNILMGYNVEPTDVNGSYQLNIGNTIYGDLDNGEIALGVAQNDPRATLQINGSFMYSDGNEAANYVLSSDANGLATWISASVLLSNGGAFLDTLNDVISDRDSNLFLGNGAGLNHTGEYNTGVGIRALTSLTSGNGNVAFGYEAGNGITSGSDNVLLGKVAGNGATSGSGNIFIGNVNGDSATASNQLNIGDLLYGEFDNGNIGIGVENPGNFKLEVAGNIGPSADSTHDLGTTAIRWANIYADTIDSTTVNATTINGSTLDGGFTTGSVLFGNASGYITEDNANFFWDDTGNNLGIGTTSPVAKLEVNGFGLIGDSANYVTAIGRYAADNMASGSQYVNALGYQAGQDNNGDYINAFGYRAADNNVANNINALGREAARDNNGSNVNAMGANAANQNTGDDVNSFGSSAASNNIGNKVNALGNLAGINNNGDHLNALGHWTAYNNIGDYVNALGPSAAFSNQGTHVNALGNTAAQNNTGSFVNAFGPEAAYNNNDTAVNAFGYRAAKSSIGSNLNAFGFTAAQTNNGNLVNALGNAAAYNNNGDDVNALGFRAAFNNEGDDILAIGSDTAYNNEGNELLAIGLQSAYNNKGDGSIAFGRGTLFSANGDYNIAIGYLTADTLKNGARNIFLGYNVEPTDVNGSYQLNIGNTIYGDLDNGEIALGVAQNDPRATLQINGTIMIADGTESNGYILMSDANGLASWVSTSSTDAGTLNGLTSDQFLRSDTSDNYTSGTLTLNSGTEINPASGSTVDIDGDLEIADTNISLDGASTTFTQTTGAITLAPAAGSNLNVSLSGAGDMVVNTDDFYVDSSTGNIGINETTPSARLEVNGFGLIGDADNWVIALGQAAADNMVTANSTYVNAIGYQSAQDNNGQHINALGYRAADNNTGDNINAMGRRAAGSNSGDSVNALGYQAGITNTGSNVNIMGYQAAQVNIGTDVNAIGYQAAEENNGNDLNAFGNIAAQYNIGGNVNALGDGAARYNNGSNLNAIGAGSAANNIGGAVNAIGPGAAANNNGDNVNALGNNSSQNNTGSDVNALGYYSARNNSGSYVEAFGSYAAQANKGDGVIAIGRDTLKIANGDYNIAIGYQTGDTVKNGAQNVLLGYNVEPTDVNGSYQLNIGNTIYGDLDNGEIALGVAQNDPRATLQINGTFMYADGNEAANYVLSSDANGLASWISASVLLSNGGAFLDTLNDVISDRDSNLFLGNGAGLAHTGDYNTGVGIRALENMVGGDGNVAFGYQAGRDMTSGSDNVLIGKVAGNGATSGSGNIFIGNVNGDSTTATNQLNIGDLLFGEFDNGNVGIGVENPGNFKLEVAGNVGPNADSTHDLGTTALRWANAFIDDITITNNGSFGNDIAVTDDAVIGGDAHITGVVNGGTFDGDFTNGSVLFSNASGVISEDNSNFYWDNTNDRLAIANGTSPTAKLEINTGSDTEKAMIIKANSAQSANLLETYENGGALRAHINESGEFSNKGGSSTSEIFGDGATVNGANSVVIGYNASAPGDASYDGNSNVVIGSGASSSSKDNVVVGYSASSTQFRNTVIGYNASANNQYQVAIGYGVAASGYSSIAIGGGSSAYSATLGGTSASSHEVALGVSASTSASESIAIGRSANASSRGAIALGYQAATTAGGQFVVSSGTTNINDVWVGGVTLTSPDNITYHAPSGSGTDIDGSNLILASGRSTGSGAGGELIFQTTAPGASSASLNTSTERMRITDDGNIGINSTAPVAKLQINGTIMIADGTESNGYILMSDANGLASWVSTNSTDAGTLDGLDSLQFLRSDTSDSFTSGTMTFDAGTTVDINSTTLQIADTNITFDGASTTLTQTTGDFNLVPNSNVGIDMASPSQKLDVNGSVAIAASSSSYYIGTDSIMYANGDGNRVTRLGVGAGSTFNGATLYNTAIGYNTLDAANQSGDYNTAIGYSTMSANTTGAQNTALGGLAMGANTTGSNNTAVGLNSLSSNTSAGSNTAIGHEAMENTTTGDENVALGRRALWTNTSGQDNVAVGYRALTTSNGDYNTGLGYEAGDAITEGSSNTTLGHQAGDNITTGSSNIVIGAGADAVSVDGDYQLNIGNTIYGDLNNGEIALGKATEDPSAVLEVNGSFMYTDGNEAANYVLSSDANGLATWISASVLLSNGGAFLDTLNDVISDRDSNLFLGNGAGLAHTGDYNTGVGIRALENMVGGDGNVAFGYQAGRDMTSGSDNVLIGKVAGNGATSGSGNIFIGNVNGDSTTATNQLNIGDLLYGEFDNGNIGIGVENPGNFKLEVAGNVGPSADSTHDLGTTAIRWANAFIDDLTITNNGSFGNDIAVTDDAVIGGDANVTGVVNGGTFDGDFTNGSVLFSNSTGVISEDNSNFYWDNTNDRLAIANGTSPTAKLEINTGSDTEKAVIIKANSAQSANLLETYENGGALRATVNESGEFTNTGGKSQSEVFGDGAEVGAPKSTAIGYGAKAGSADVFDKSIAIGYNANGTAYRSVVIGANAIGSGSGVAIGTSSISNGANAIAIGKSATAESQSVAIGEETTAAAAGVALGETATAGSYAISIGYVSKATGARSTAIGTLADCTHTGSVCIGIDATSTANYQMVVGSNYSAGSHISDVYIGRGVTHTAKHDTTYHATGGSGTDIAGGDIVLAGGKGTGNADGGDIIFQTADAGATGTTLQSLTTKMIITDNGNVGINSTAPTATFQVNGSFLYSDGNEGANKVLVSDANGLATWTASGTTDAGTLDGFDSTDFLKSNGSDSYTSGTLTMDAGTTIDINSTTLQIADTDITFDGASTTFTQTTGAFSFTPATGSNLNITLADAGDFKVESNGDTFALIVNGTSDNVGIGFQTPAAKLAVNGSIMIVDGNEANGLVLTSDANGVGAWKTISNVLTEGSAFLDALNDVISDKDSNLFLGNGAGLAHTGDYNTGVGIRAFENLVGGDGNVVFGYQAGRDMTSGSDNVLIGKVAANGATSGSGNIFIGNVNGSSTTASNELNIGDLIYGGFSTGNVGIGVEAPSNFGLEVAGNIGPDADSTRDLGTTAIRWANIYADTTDSTTVNATTINGSTLDGGFTTGSVLFGNASGYITEDNANFFWDDTANNLGIGDTSPGQKLSVNGDISFGSKLYAQNGSAQVFYYPATAGNTGTIIVGDAGATYDAAADYNTIVGIQAGDAITTGDYNVAMGYQSLSTNNGGNYNTAIGTYSLSNSTAAKNTAVGYVSLQNNSTGANNAAFGANALKNNTIGSENTALGTDSMISNINGSNNTAVGKGALENNTASSNTAVGHRSLENNKEGTNNNALGALSLINIRNGDYNIGLGSAAGYIIKGGSYNIAIGDNSLREARDSSYNIAIGSSALRTNTDGQYNTAVGYRALYTSNGDDNTAFGYDAGDLISEGSNNTLFGYRAGDNITTGSTNIIIGSDVDAVSATASNQLNIGNTIYGDINNGEVYLGAANIDPSATLHINGSFLYDDGNQTDGFILSSNASGIATWVNSDTLTAGDAATLDGFDSTDFLKSNGSDSFTSGTLTLAASTALDAGAAESLEVPNSAAPTLNAAGELALDTTITSYTPLLKYYSGTEEMTVVGMPTSEMTTTDGHVVAYNSTNGEFEMVLINSGEWTDTGSVLHPNEETVDNVVVGGTTTGGADIILGVDGSAIFNEQGADVDFRIESNNMTNVFVVNGTTDGVGMGTNTPDGILHLDNGTSNTDFIIEKDNTTQGRVLFHTEGSVGAMFNFNTNEDLVIENETSDKDIIFKVNDGGVDTEVARFDGSTSRFGIGYATPSQKLSVNGTVMSTGIRLEDGNQAAGYVLSSDAGGNGSWASIASLTVDADTLDGLDSTDFLKSNGSDSYTAGTLTFDAGTTVDINSTTLQIADTDITFDGASTTFTQSSGAFTFSPAAGSNMNISLSGTGDLAINTDDLYVDSSTSNVGISTSTPGATLDVNGTVAFDPSSTTNITAGGGITATSAIMRVQGSGGAVNITANPQIADGTDGQIIIVKGMSDTNTLTLDDGEGLELADGASFTLGNRDTISLMYDAVDDIWIEISRSNN